MKALNIESRKDKDEERVNDVDTHNLNKYKTEALYDNANNNEVHTDIIQQKIYNNKQ